MTSATCVAWIVACYTFLEHLGGVQGNVCVVFDMQWVPNKWQLLILLLNPVLRFMGF